ncbi:MAG TPA: hypothetical protein VK052_08355, partial [Zeimonas sp.]|nr:hypothetical protein [Zeimonas sp.]
MSADTPTPVGPPAPASPPARGSPIDRAYLLDVLGRLLAIRSPSGMTDQIVLAVSDELDGLGIPYGLTRRGAIRADLEGARHSPDRAIVAHLDTLGAMVRGLKDNGRLAVVPIGHWSARFAEGARLTIFTDEGRLRGTCLPLKASGHAFGDEVDSQPVGWDYVEVRVDAPVHDRAGLEAAGINVGDWIAIDPQPEIQPGGYINSRYL